MPSFASPAFFLAVAVVLTSGGSLRAQTLTASVNTLPEAPGEPLVQPAPPTIPQAEPPPAPQQAAQLTTQDPPSSSSQPAKPQPAGQVPPNADPALQPLQTKRILGVVPNYRSVSADEHLPPQSVKQKFLNAGRDSFDYGSFILAAFQAGSAMNSKSYPEFHQGVVGYGRYYWHTLADTGSENFMVGGAVPALTRQDPRFYTLGHGSIAHRAFYGATRVLVTRTDAGNAAPNVSEIIGAGAASGISSLYYPTHYRTWTKVGQKWLTSIVIDSANYSFKEFWPDINQHVLHGRGGGGSGTE